MLLIFHQQYNRRLFFGACFVLALGSNLLFALEVCVQRTSMKWSPSKARRAWVHAPSLNQAKMIEGRAEVLQKTGGWCCSIKTSTSQPSLMWMLFYVHLVITRESDYYPILHKKTLRRRKSAVICPRLWSSKWRGIYMQASVQPLDCCVFSYLPSLTALSLNATNILTGYLEFAYQLKFTPFSLNLFGHSSSP